MNSSFILQGIAGLLVLLTLTFLLSNNRRAIKWRLVAAGVALQILIAVLALRVPGFVGAVDWVSARFLDILNFSFAGVDLLFGSLADSDKHGPVLALNVFGTIIFFSALTALLYYLRILQWIVYGMAWIMHRAMGLSGPECLAAAANVLIGQTEAPLLVKPYLRAMTRSELMALMTGGMATIAGSVLAIYVQILGGDPEGQQRVAKMLITASLMSAPAALVVAKMLIPETRETSRELLVPRDRIGTNALDAVTRGAGDGLKLALNVVAMIIAFYGLIYLVNWILGGIGGVTGADTLVRQASGGTYEAFTLQSILGFVFAPIAWIIGAESADILVIGELLGTKLCLNEFIAFQRLGELSADLSPRSVFVVTFALCGFANFGSIGIQIGGIAALAPERRSDLAALGFRAMIGGAIASLMTASVAGMFFVK